MKLDRNKYLNSRSLKPLHVFLFILAINLTLGILVLAVPNEGIQLGDVNLKFVSFDFLRGEYHDSSRVELKEVLAGVVPDKSAEDEKDTNALEVKLLKEVQRHSGYDSSKKVIAAKLQRSIQLPPKNPQALATLIDALMNESETKLVRILHYGDSQLEGDRITDYLRNRLQILFGGSGPGLVLPLEPAAGIRRSVLVNQSSNFSKKAFYIQGENEKSGFYGLGGSIYQISGRQSKFSGYEKISNSISSDSVARFTGGKNSNAYISLRTGATAYSKAKEYTNIRLIYKNDAVSKMRFSNDSGSRDVILDPTKLLGIKSIKSAPSKQAKFEFTAGKFPSLLGIMLDAENGVAVDNIAMRGSSAIGFDKVNSLVYSKQLRDLNVRCILLQYGINVVPNVRSDYDYYKNILVKQLSAIRMANPNVSIIVIGPSDMSRKKGGVKVSYSNIPLIRDAMKSAAFETGCAFWDLYEAMGGENSMVSWVEQGLGQKDYTHFSFKGAKYVGELLFEAIIEQVNNEELIQDGA